jgi:hypothetical protein
MQRAAESRFSDTGPEDAVLSDQDRLIITEFLTELDALEQRVFWLTAEGDALPRDRSCARPPRITSAHAPGAQQVGGLSLCHASRRGFA